MISDLLDDNYVVSYLMVAEIKINNTKSTIGVMDLILRFYLKCTSMPFI